MKVQKWIHVGWAVAALAAFYIGSKTAAPSRDAETASNSAQQSDRARASNDGRMPGTSSQDARSRRDKSGTAGPLEKLFGSYSLDRVGLKALTEQAIKDPSPITRRLAFAKLLENMTADNVLEIREQLVTLDPDDRTWLEFNYAFGALKGREAFEFALTSDEPDLNSTMMGWAAADPQGAMAMMSQLPPEVDGQRAQLEQNLVAGIADNDINLATQVALSMSGTDERQNRRLMSTVANEVLRGGGAETAALWVNTLPDGAAKGAAMQRVTEEYVRKDPAAAAAWAEGFADKPYASSAIGEIGSEWAETDAPAAAAWLETLPQGSAQNRGFREALGEWENRDPQAATAYLMSMESSPRRDAAIAGFANGHAWKNPQAAIKWAQDISDPQTRQQSLIRIGYAYHRHDPINARTWLENSGLTPTQQRQAMMGGR